LKAQVSDHVDVFRQAGRFAGWPANYGMWAWGDELVLGFTVGAHLTEGRFHARDISKPFVNLQARSLDAGRSWSVSPFPGHLPGGRGLSADEHMNAGMRLGEALDREGVPLLSTALDFTHPDFALICARTGLLAGTRSLFYYSYDRCRSWTGPFALPMWGQTAIAARTDYIVLGPERCVLFLTANKPNGEEGRVLCAETRDGGRNFELLSFIGLEGAGRLDYSIMPASLHLASGAILVANRLGEADERFWIDIYRSDDEGRSWQYISRPVTFQDLRHQGNPATLSELADGRIVLTYGNRDKPHVIAARISHDQGRSWSEELVLRPGGGSHDIGYPRTVTTADGTLVTAYYFNDAADRERYIAATRWRP
jgi:hypothetical protein